MDISSKNLTVLLKNTAVKKPSVGGKCPTASAIQTELHCAAMLSPRLSCG